MKTVLTIVAAIVMSLMMGCGSDSQTIGIDPLGLMGNYNTGPKAEIALGNYDVTVAIPDSHEALYVTFDAVGIVPEEKKAQLEKEIEKHKTRLRDRVNSTVQRISHNQLKDPQFVWLKSELTQAINKELKVQDFHEIVFSGFSLERR